MKLVVVLSGAVGSGKSTLGAAVLAAAKDGRRISTREVIVRLKGVESRREPLQRAGDELDVETGFSWVADEVSRLEASGASGILVVDAVRRAEQVAILRKRFGERIRHVHLVASPTELERRHGVRDHDVIEPEHYSTVQESETERQVASLAKIADVVTDATRLDTLSIAAAALANTGYAPRPNRERLVDVLVGGQYGSEGKGNVCSMIAPDYQVLVRVGGPNAGHIVYDPHYKFMQLPSGSRHNQDARLVLGPGTTISLDVLLREIRELEISADRLSIDPQAVIIEEEDRAWEAGALGGIGSTTQGVGSATARKILGRGGAAWGAPVRLARDVPELSAYLRPTFVELEKAYAAGERVLLEGTQGTDISLHHGMWPHVTSRDTTAAGCLADAGIAPGRVGEVIAVVRTYPIRVGGTSGYMGVEIDAEDIAARSGLPVENIRRTETGTVSGNPRRIGLFDLGQVRRSVALNGATMIALTFADYLGKENRQARSFEQLNDAAREFVARLEDVTGVPVGLISCGPGASNIIDRRQV